MRGLSAGWPRPTGGQADLSRSGPCQHATDRQALYDVLRGGMFCQLGVILDGDPLVLPTAYGVELNRGPGGTLYLQGPVPAARSVRAAGDHTVCVTVTQWTGWCWPGRRSITR